MGISNSWDPAAAGGAESAVGRSRGLQWRATVSP